ncbi:class GN sortase [Glaciecola siphonariae]|uniref:Class GN sortase n=1 Tax=Glaciecola siphonariae TaxID=521012 RepID=A0ABV9LZR2_9ALTE
MSMLNDMTMTDQVITRRKLIHAMKLATLLVFLSGIGFIANGTYTILKAELAQVLMHKAWMKGLYQGHAQAPWSWADTKVIGKIRYLEDEYFILSGESGRNLAFGPALMSASAPLDKQGNSVIAGHRDTHFSALKHLKTGDIIELEYIQSDLAHSAKRQYEVLQTMVLEQDRMDVLNGSDHALLTLITCYPFDSVLANPKNRYVIRAAAIYQ